MTDKEKEKKQEKTEGSKDKPKGKSKVAKEKKEKKSGESTSQTAKTEKEKESTSSKSAKEESIEKLSILDDNSSFFSHNTFQKIVPESREDDTSPAHPSPILTDSMPDIGTSEDWAAAFGFNKIETLQNCTESSSPIDSFFRTDDFRNLIEASKLQDNIRDALAKNNGYTMKPQPQTQDSYFGKESGLDQHMSKFFMDFHQKNGQKENSYNMGVNHSMNSGMNGFSHLNNYFMNPDRLLLLQQKKLEEHLMSLSMKQHQSYGPMSTHSSGQYRNGDVGQNGYGDQWSFQSQQTQMSKSRTHSEDDLGFDPFQETQKALAELIANEQSYKTHNNGE